MKYGAGAWVFIQTERSQGAEYFPLQEVLKNEFRHKMSAFVSKLGKVTKKIKVVLIDFPESDFLAKLPTDLRKCTTVMKRRNQCEILFDEKSGQIQVSAEDRRPVRTLIVDDSSTMRLLIKKILEADSRFEVAAEAATPGEAYDLITKNKFDLITMDLHLPEMSGADLIKKYFRENPIPTVVISSLRPEESDLVLQSLENGAVDYIQKPEQKELAQAKTDILQRLYVAASAKVRKLEPTATAGKGVDFKNEKNLLVIGASTGGTEAIRKVLQQVGSHIPPTVIVQHIPPIFSKSFAERLNRLLPFEVKEAEDGDAVLHNRVLIAPGGKQMKLVKVGGQYKVKITDDGPVNRHKPSVDFLFNSVVECYKGPMVAVLLTGMGADGADGMVNLRKFGAHTIAQDESSSVVFGMPREAIARGGACEIIDLYKMGEAIHGGYPNKN